MNSPTLARSVRSIEAAAIAGLVYAVLYSVSLILLTSAPEASVPDAELTGWYSDPDNRTLLVVGLALSVASTIAFLWFLAVVRRRVGDREDQFFATVFLGSGILLSGVALIGASVLASPSLTIDLADGRVPDWSTLSSLTGLGNTLFFFVLLRVQAVFVVSTSTLAMRTGAFSRYLAYLGYVTALTMFVMPIATEPLGFAFPIWVAILSLALVTRRTDMRASSR
jgi:hypothetical protein